MRAFWIGCLLAAGAASLACVASAAELKPGDTAPTFKLEGSDGQVHDLATLTGKTVVLAWFPKAFTSG